MPLTIQTCLWSHDYTNFANLHTAHHTNIFMIPWICRAIAPSLLVSTQLFSNSATVLTLFPALSTGFYHWFMSKVEKTVEGCVDFRFSSAFQHSQWAVNSHVIVSHTDIVKASSCCPFPRSLGRIAFMTSQKESLRERLYYHKTSLKLLGGLIYFKPIWGGWGGGGTYLI